MSGQNIKTIQALSIDVLGGHQALLASWLDRLPPALPVGPGHRALSVSHRTQRAPSTSRFSAYLVRRVVILLSSIFIFDCSFFRFDIDRSPTLPKNLHLAARHPAMYRADLARDIAWCLALSLVRLLIARKLTTSSLWISMEPYHL
ncbi:MULTISPECIES: hypothetical protein [unclassified Aeromonas]|uniref:hypothetical protein n=1 Tax=unclassified Aeromonas TaxID=257493 RepID=UPI0022E63B1F|nr:MULTISPECIES: hypothetical protein [unclassified Aeromonas]